MECNKDEAIKTKEIANRKMQNGDFKRTRKIASKAQQLYLELENISQMLTTREVHCSAQNKLNSSTWIGMKFSSIERSSKKTPIYLEQFYSEKEATKNNAKQTHLKLAIRRRHFCTVLKLLTSPQIDKSPPPDFSKQQQSLKERSRQIFTYFFVRLRSFRRQTRGNGLRHENRIRTPNGFLIGIMTKKQKICVLDMYVFYLASLIAVKPEIISWSPRIIVLHNFLSMENMLALPLGGGRWGVGEDFSLRFSLRKLAELNCAITTFISDAQRSIVYSYILLLDECDYLRAMAKPRLRTSTVVDVKTGKGVESKVRTSSGMFLSSEEKKYPMVQRGGQRVATMLMYLSDNVEGGETYFPMIPYLCHPHLIPITETLQEEEEAFVRNEMRKVQCLPQFQLALARVLAGSGKCSCGGKVVEGLSVKPIKGDAVLFWSMGLDGQSDPNSIHGGCEVISGEKWSATKWMRQRTTS
ncbi:unnamed protein product [Dovyalis caffra]|uniref:Prolyl 4-hydroxylase alpha subunit domain-containing protein n=1 Tax=Dovyalis caffra TaxID=77055 RepID=A0AAV1SBW7_9ROSI|nr:unnamed protein product [Dovyalis caffra]